MHALNYEIVIILDFKLKIKCKAFNKRDSFLKIINICEIITITLNVKTKGISTFFAFLAKTGIEFKIRDITIDTENRNRIKLLLHYFLM